MDSRPVVERGQQPVHLEVRQRELVPQPTRKQCLSVTDPGKPPDELDAGGGQGVEIQRPALRRADELRRGESSRAHQIVDFVVPLVPHTGGIHPPEYVATSIGPRQAHVLADRKDDGSARPGDLVGELHARRRRSHDQHAAVGQMARIAVIERRHGLDVWRQCLRERRHAGDVAGAARQHHGAALQHARIRRDGVPDVCTCDRGDGGVRAHGSGDHHRVARDELHHLAHGHVAVRITAFVVIPGQSALPVGRQQTKRIPALPAPGIRRLSALEHDVVDGASSETSARRKTRMPGPDDDRGDLLDGDAPLQVHAAYAGEARLPRRSRSRDW